MIPTFNPEALASHEKENIIEYKMPTRVENDKQLVEYTDYLRSVGQGEGMGSITAHDLDIFYHLFEVPQKFSNEKVERLFGLLSRLASAERFESQEEAQECLNMIEHYKTELGL